MIPGLYDPIRGFSLLRLADFRKADELKQYVDWAVNHGLGIIDVNLPKHLTGIDV